MQVLPFADQVREARVRALYAEKAANLSHRVGISLSAVSISERQIRNMDIDDLDIPGQAVVDEAIDLYPELSGLAGIAPDPAATPLRQLEQRRLQLRTIDQFIRPIAATHEDLTLHVHELQHQQARAIQRPEFESLRQELDQRGETRRRGTITASRLRTRRQTLRPVEHAVDDFLPEAETELAAGDPRSLEFARMRLLTLIETLEVTARSSGLETRFPGTDVLGDPECGVDVLADAVSGLRLLREATRVEVEMLEAEIDRVEAEVNEATEWMVARTG